MVTMIPVVEALPDGPFRPVGPAVEPYRTIPLTPDRMGAVVWALVGWSGGGEGPAATPAEAIEVYLACDDDMSYASGGLRVAEGAVVIDPSCCDGLGEWRDWVGAAKGCRVGFGHDPDVWAEPRGELIRVWEDGSESVAGVPGPAARHVDIPRDALPDLLRGVQRDLAEFLHPLRRWALDTVPGLADPFVLAVERRLDVSAPLDV